MNYNATIFSGTKYVIDDIFKLNTKCLKISYTIKFKSFDKMDLHLHSFKFIKSENFNVAIILILAYWRRFDYFTSIKLLKNSNKYELKLLLALIYLYQNKTGFQNIKLGEKIFIDLALNSKRIEAIVLLIEFYLYYGKQTECQKWCSYLETLDYGSANYYLSLINTNYLKKIDQSLNAVTAKIPDDRGYIILSEITSKKKDFALIAVRKKIIDAYALLGEWCYKMNDFITMKHLFDSGIERENVESLKCLVNFYIKMHDYEGIKNNFHNLMMKIELNQRLIILSKIIKLYISDEYYDKAERLAKFYIKYDNVSASYLLAEIYEKQKKFDQAFNVYLKLSSENNKYAMCKLGLYYIYGYGAIKIDEKKGLELLQKSGTKLGKEIIDICSLKGVLGKEKVLEGFENLNQNIAKSPVAALYIFACYHYGYCVGKDIIEEERLSRLLKEEHKKTREEIITFLFDNRDLCGNMIKKEHLSRKVLF